MENICNKCNKNVATYHYTQNINGREASVHLCKECLEKSERYKELFASLDDRAFFGFDSFLSDTLLPRTSLSAKKRTQVLSKSDVCPLCKSDLESIRKSKRLGCSHCFEHFKDKMDMSLLFKAQDEEKKSEGELSLLKEKLCEAIKNEDYTLASLLRDKIRALEKNKA